ncbi:MAG: hypothetical protein AB4290_00275 [Spirulina sp.]
MMSDSPNPEKLSNENRFQLVSVTEKLVTTGSLKLSSPEEAKSERQNIDKDKELEREQKRINFWVKDISVFLFLLFIVFLIDIYGFTVLLDKSASEIKIRFALVVLSSTVTSFLSYLLGKSSQ